MGMDVNGRMFHKLLLSSLIVLSKVGKHPLSSCSQIIKGKSPDGLDPTEYFPEPYTEIPLW
jgi:hypothetical protein